MESYAHLGANVRYFRLVSALSQQDLATRTRAALTQRQVSDLERGCRPSDPADVDVLAAALQTSRAALLRRPRTVRSLANLQALVLACQSLGIGA